MAALRALWKCVQFVFWSVLLAPFQVLVLLAAGESRTAFALPRLWHRLIGRAFGLDVECVGDPVADSQVLYVANHISWLDIPVLGAAVPTAFVAKREVAGWPVFGLLARLQKTAFINRARSASAAEKDALKTVLAAGRSLVLFAEGTSSSGTDVLPFRSALFGLFEGAGTPADLRVQPVTVELLETNGHPVYTAAQRDLYAWHGEMTLMPHFWAFACGRGAKVRLHFHPPFRVQQGTDRKDLAGRCHAQVAAPLARAARSADLIKQGATAPNG